MAVDKIHEYRNYMRNNGTVAKGLRFRTNDRYPWIDNEGLTYTSKGVHCISRPGGPLELAYEITCDMYADYAETVAPKAGRNYHRRNNSIAECLQRQAKPVDPDYPWIDSIGRTYTENGRYDIGELSQMDLMGEAEDTALTAINTPLGLLSPSLRKRLLDHGGPYDVWRETGWAPYNDDILRSWLTFRARPLPATRRMTMDGWLLPDGLVFPHKHCGKQVPVTATWVEEQGKPVVSSYRLTPRKV